MHDPNDNNCKENCCDFMLISVYGESSGVSFIKLWVGFLLKVYLRPDAWNGERQKKEKQKSEI